MGSKIVSKKLMNQTQNVGTVEEGQYGGGYNFRVIEIIR